ncbi:MAG: FkbM family methyltransferase [Thermomicrobiales bacterium]
MMSRFKRIAARLQRNPDNGISHLERGIVARFDAMNQRLDADYGRMKDLIDGHLLGPTRLRAEIDRLDGNIVYHFLELSREMERLSKQVQANEAAIARSALLYSSASVDAVIRYFGFDIVIPSEEIGLISFLARHGTESVEPGVTAVIRSCLSEDATAIDVGANVGLHSVTMAERVGSGGKVIAIEANTAIAQALLKTVRLNALGPRVTVLVGAASDRVGTAKFYQLPHSPESSLFPLSGSSVVEVESIRIDDLIPEGATVDLVKIDVEGAEALVYQGMSRVLAQNPGLNLIMEWSSPHFERTGIDPGAFYRRIREDGFRSFLIDDSRPGELVAFTDLPDRIEASNILFSRRRGDSNEASAGGL